jgi:putative ABC transport system substrate-binding protein
MAGGSAAMWTLAGAGCGACADGKRRAAAPRPLVVFLDDSEAVQGARLEIFRAALADVDLTPQRIAFERVEVAGSSAEELRRTISSCAARNPVAFVTASSDVASTGFPFMGRIPLIAATTIDPVKLGIDDDGGPRRNNVTGFSYDIPLEAKAFEVLADAFPRAKRVAVIADRTWIEYRRREIDLDAARERFGMTIDVVVPSSPSDVRPELQRIHPDRVDACYLPLGDVPFYSAGFLIEYFQRHRMPNLFAQDLNVASGALMSYGIRRNSHWLPMARMLRLVIAGVPAREIPFERPKDFVLAVNVGQAEKMGIRIPKSILRRANLIV